MTFSGFDLRLTYDAVHSVLHALDPVLRFVRGEGELLHDKVSIAA
jgi:hypothetical protein